MKNHLKVHFVKNPYSCRLCTLSFSNSTELENHETAHNPKKPFTCSHCKEFFVKYVELREHIKAHKQCEICNTILDTNTWVTHNLPNIDK